MKKYFSKKYSKIQVLNSILSSLNKSESDTDKLLIHTANGIYQGTLRDSTILSDTEIKANDDILTCFDKMYQSALNTYEISDNAKDNIAISDPISIELENVELFTSLKTIHMPFAIIFVDQIIGFSIGHVK